MAEQLDRGRVVTLEVDPDRVRQARDFWKRAGVADRIDLVEGDALETLEAVTGPFDLLFVDAAKEQYESYIELAEPKLSERALLVVDNTLMSGEVALSAGTDTRWRVESLEAARVLNAGCCEANAGWGACCRWATASRSRPGGRPGRPDQRPACSPRWATDCGTPS